jgi:hypothetical protein
MSSVVRLLGQALIHGYIVLLMVNTGIRMLAQEQVANGYTTGGYSSK